MAVYSDDRAWKCGLCKEPLISRKITFRYVGREVAHEVSCCPKCGKVFITKGLAEGRMAEVEEQLEDK